MSKVPAVSRSGRSWAVPGPSEVAQQRPMTTNDDGQAHEPTAPELEAADHQDPGQDPGQEEVGRCPQPSVAVTPSLRVEQQSR